MQGRVGLLRRLKEYGWNREGWFVPLEDALKGLGATEAAWQPPGGGNSIWQTLNHLNFYNERMFHRITNTPAGALPETNEETFGPAVDPADEAGWQQAVAHAGEIAEKLRGALAELGEADLDRPLKQGTVGDSLVAWIMHDAYHTGQIVLLRKQQGCWPATR